MFQPFPTELWAGIDLIWPFASRKRQLIVRTDARSCIPEALLPARHFELPLVRKGAMARPDLESAPEKLH